MVFHGVCFLKLLPPKPFVSVSDEENTVIDLRLMQHFIVLPSINIAAFHSKSISYLF
jgi:hypothetical protein